MASTNLSRLISKTAVSLCGSSRICNSPHLSDSSGSGQEENVIVYDGDFELKTDDCQNECSKIEKSEEAADDDSDVDTSSSSLERFSRGSMAPRIVRCYNNKTFSDLQIREIERENDALMKKILRNTGRSRANSFANKLPSYACPPKMTSHAINRKKNQMKIDWENQILLRKIQAVKPSMKYK